MTAPQIPFEDLLEGDFAACCAQLYEQPAVRWLLDGELHPGGEALTLRAAQLAGVTAGSRVLDLACGRGTTALALASELRAEAVGVDAGAGSVAAARAAADERGLAGAVRFEIAEATALPLESASFDAALCECSLCLFEDKPAAVRELARVLRPGGRVAIADVTADRDRLPDALRAAAARVACIGDALPATGYRRLLEDAGIEVGEVEDHGEALAALADRVETRLRAARIARVPELEPFAADLGAAIDLVRQTLRAIDDGALGYVLIAGRRRDDPPGADPARGPRR